MIHPPCGESCGATAHYETQYEQIGKEEKRTTKKTKKRLQIKTVKENRRRKYYTFKPPSLDDFQNAADITISASFVVCGFFVYVGAAIANTVAPDLFAKLCDSSKTVPVFLVAFSIIILGIVISTRKYPITWLFWMSVVLSFVTLPFVSFNNGLWAGACIESFIIALFNIWSFAALALGIATVVFSIYAFVILTSYLLYPYLYWLGRFVWLPIRNFAFRQSS